MVRKSEYEGYSVIFYLRKRSRFILYGYKQREIQENMNIESNITSTQTENLALTESALPSSINS